MAEANTPEPSIEDILASIRKIISDDNTESDEQQLLSGEQAPLTDNNAEDEVLELTDIAPEPLAENGPIEEIQEKESLQTKHEFESEYETNYEPEPPPEAQLSNVTVLPQTTNMMNDTSSEPASSPFETQYGEAGIVSERTMAAASGAFAKLTHTDDNSAETRISGDAKSVEDIARELLRPILREWVDQNLPQLVERLVERELRKISRKAEDL